jgi:alpha-tubulin suppressor-like RCC1 family protein
MNIFSLFRKSLLLALISMIITSCDSLTVFVPPDRSSSLESVSGLIIDENGYLTVTWAPKPNAPKSLYEIYLLEVPSDDATLAFTSAASKVAPLIYEETSIHSKASPKKIGKLVGKTSTLSLTLTEQLNPGQKYLLEISERGVKQTSESKAVLLDVQFQGSPAALASVNGNTVVLNWSEVIGATKYEIFADKALMQLLGTSTDPTISISLSSGKALAEYYVRSSRGVLYSPELIVVPLKKAATVVKVTGTTADGTYKENEVLNFKVVLNEKVSVFGDTKLPLKMNQGYVYASYLSGTGTDTLTYTYTVAAGDNSDRLETGSVLDGEITNGSGDNLGILLPAVGEQRALKELSAIAIDTISPTAASSIGFDVAMSDTGTFTVSWQASIDRFFAGHRLKFCPTSSCDIGCSSEDAVSGTSKTYTNLPDQNVFACIQGQDTVGHKSAWAASIASIIIDKINPTSPGALVFAGTNSSSLTFAMSWTASVETNLKHYKTKLCLANDCATDCGAITTSTALTQTMTGINGETYFGCVQAEDKLGHLSAWVPSAMSILVDTSIPTVLNVTSASPNASYKEGDSLTFLVQFSEPISVANASGIRLQLETGTIDHYASNASVSGADTLAFTYVVQAGDTAAHLDYLATNALTLGGGSIRDASGNNADLRLPDLAGSDSLFGRQNIRLDTTTPTVASAVAFSSSLNTSTSMNVSWTASSDTNFLQHNVKLCSSTDCSSSCLTPITAAGSNAILTGVNGGSYYACVQGEDTVGHKSSWIASNLPASIDTTAPTVTNVTVTNANGPYKQGDALTVRVTFSEPVTVAGQADLSLMLGTGVTPHPASYSLGSTSNTLDFSYIVQSGDTSADLESESTGALTLGATGLIRDASGNNAILTLPALGGSASIAGQKAIILDTTPPTSASSIGFASGYSNATSFNLSWANSFDSNFAMHNVKLCSSSDCITGCLTEVTSTTSPLTITGSNGGTYYGCVQGQDTAGQKSAWVSSLSSIQVDTSAPTVLKVTSTNANGSYKAGALIDISIQFSEIVNVTSGNAFALLLASGGAGSNAVYVSGDESDTLLFRYAVQAGDISSDLDYASSSALSLGAGTLVDNAGNNAVLALPAPAAANSLGQSKAIILDTSAPAAPVIQVPAQNAYVMSLVNSISGTAESGSTIEVREGSTVLGTTVAASGSWSLDLTASPLSDGDYTVSAKATDVAGNVSSLSAVRNFEVDTIAPLAPVIAALSSPTTNTAPTVIGTAEASVTIKVYKGATLLGSTTADSNGDWSYPMPSQVSGSYSINATATDVGGRVSVVSNAVPLIIDTINPTAPSAVAFSGGAASNTTSVPLTWTNSTDANFRYHNLKLCENIDCNTSCTPSSTSVASPATLLGLDSKTYYGCVQGEDLVGHVSSWTPSSGTVTITATGATVTAVTSAKADGFYKVGETIDVTLTFSKNLTLTNPTDINLLMETGSVDRTAPYLSNTGSSITFRYTVQAIDTAADLDYQSTGALTLGATGRIQDSPPVNDAIITLPPTGSASSLAGQKAIVIDNTAPTAPTSVGFASNLSKTAAFNMSWAASTDLNFNTHNVKICTSSDCNTNCASASTALTSPKSMTGVDGATYYGCVQGQDKVALTSPWIASLGTVTVDLTAPTIIQVSSTKTNGSYKAGEAILLTVLFSEAVVVSNDTDVTLLLDTGVMGSNASYVSGSTTNTLNFLYTVAAGENSSDLNYLSSSALDLGSSGTIRDIAGNSAALALPATNNSNALAGQKNLVIDTTAPIAPTITSHSNNSYLLAAITTISGTSESGATVQVKNGSTVLGSATASGTTWSLTLGTALSDGVYSLSAIATDSVGNTGVASAPLAVTVDTSAPTAPVISALTSPTLNVTPTISGTSEANAQIKVYSGAILVGTTSANTLGAWSVATSTLSEGSNSITATSTDPGARVSAASAAVPLVIDTISPTAPSAVAFASAWSNTASLNFNWTNGADANLRYHAVQLCTNISCSAGCVSSNTFTSGPASLAAAEGIAYYACVQSEDSVGHKSAWVASTSTATVDLTAPLAPVISSPANNSTSATLLSTISGSSESGAVVSVYVDGVLKGTTTASGTAWSYALSPTLANGTYSIKANARDAAGNIGADSLTTTATVAVPAPTANAGSDTTTAVSVSLVGTATNNASQLWTKVSGPGTITFGSASALSTSASASISGTYVLRLTVTNASNVTTSDDMTLIWDSVGPTFPRLVDFWQKSTSETRVYWAAATDNYTAPKDIVYEVCVNATPGTCAASFTATYTVPPNSFEYAVTGLTGGEEIVVRALDSLGNKTVAPAIVPKIVTNAVQVNGGYDYHCALLGSPGVVHCWGRSDYGQLGIGSTNSTLQAGNVLGITNAIAVASAGYHSCALISGGTVKCWGYGDLGRLGNGSNSNQSSPVQVSGITDAVEISTLDDSSCARLSDGRVKCWGGNNFGQLGNNTTTSSSVPVFAAVSGVANISVGNKLACARYSNGTAKCWGQNTSGELGNGATSAYSSVPVDVIQTDIAVLSAGRAYSCAALNDQSVKCWGNNATGLLGNGTTTSSVTPVSATGVTNAVSISAGTEKVCALLANQGRKCWGGSGYGAFDNGSFSDSTSPVTSQNLTSVAYVGRTYGRSLCNVLLDGTIRCSGRSEYLSLGNGLERKVVSPIKIASLGTSVYKVRPGDNHSCALISDGTVKCWGRANRGQVGDGQKIRRNEPVFVSGITTAVDLAVAGETSCAVLSDKTIKCWGKNDSGELANGSFGGDTATPVAIASLSNVISIEGWFSTFCAILGDKTVRCWGANGGRLGDNTTSNRATPVNPGLTDVVKISVGGYHTCAVTGAGAIYCWGRDNSGELGQGAANSPGNLAPLLVSSINNAIDVATPEYTSCALLSDQTVKCWGFNGAGRAGKGDTSAVNIANPTTVAGVSGATRITSGVTHVCVLLADQTAKCWGHGTGLGDGVGVDTGSPVDVRGLTGIVRMKGGQLTTCAVLVDGTARCWGNAEITDRALGDGAPRGDISSAIYPVVQ